MHDDDDYDGSSGPFHTLAIFICALMWACGIIIAAWLILGSTVARAQPLCMPLGDMVRILAEGYGEQRAAMGTSPDGKSATIVFASKDGKTFTVAIVNTAGVACAISGGMDWETYAFPADGVDG